MKLQKDSVKKTRFAELELDCILTDDELKDCAETLAHTIQERTEIRLELKQVKSQFKERIDKCEKVIIQSSNSINSGTEKRLIECSVELNKPKDGVKTITRTDTGETWETEMTTDELQEEMF